ncbi:MAG: hypothetical protein KKB13_07880 [Chloroflexi bacterium]|nr:hypothetical protein [Chloroflexota bacterium]
MPTNAVLPVPKYNVGDWVYLDRYPHDGPMKVVQVQLTYYREDEPLPEARYHVRWRHPVPFHYRQWSSDFGTAEEMESKVWPCPPDKVPVGRLADVGHD